MSLLGCRRARIVSLGVLVAGVAVVAAPGCGSSDEKKRSQDPRYEGGGGEAGEPGSGGSGVGPEGGSGGGAGSGDSAGSGGSDGNGGQPGTDGGAPNTGAGGGDGGDGCPDGFGDCDGDPSSCETPLNTLIQCGGCDISCSDANGSVACTEGQCVMTACNAGYGDCDADGTNGCELSLAEDDQNCGECGRDCAAAGSTCNTSMCAPVSLDPNASGFLSTFAGGAVYLMQSGAMPVSNYTLVRIPVDGSDRKTVWSAAANVGPGALYADATDVYWAVSGTPPSVLKKAAADASDVLPTVLFQPVAQPQFFTAQGANFYWSNNTTGLIYARAKSAAMAVSGTAIVTVSQGTYSAFTASSNYLFFVVQEGQDITLKMVPIPAGGTPTAVPDAVVSTGAPLMTVGDKLYFVRRGGANALNGLYSYTPGDTTVQQLVAHNNVNAFIVDANAIYYKLGSDYHVYKVKLTGGVGVAIATGLNNGAFAGQDDDYIYNPKDWGSNGPLYKIVK